jgi:putative ABC transport system permease protein
MLPLIRIAMRNLFEHRSKSLILGSIIALAVLVLIVGNALMDTAALGLKKAYINNYTADVMVSGIAKADVSLFGAISFSADMEKTPVIPDYEKVRTHIEGLPSVDKVTSQVSSFALLKQGENDEQGVAFMFGIEPTSYRPMFDAVEIIEGSYLEQGKAGLLLSKAKRANVERALYARQRRLQRPFEILFPGLSEGVRRATSLQVGDEIKVLGVGMGGFGGLRRIPLAGVYEYKFESMGVDNISYLDVTSARIISDLTFGNAEVSLSEEQKTIFASSEEDLFADFGFMDLDEAAAATVAATAEFEGHEEMAGKPDDGAWHAILIRLKDSSAAPAVIDQLNEWFQAEGIQAVAGDWKKAAGFFAASIDGIRIVFNVAVIIVAFVAFIIMMNTLVISVIERTGEIGTMRALGAQKGFIRRMFLAESFALTAVFGAVGIALSVIAIGIINASKIEAGNSFFQILFAGNYLRVGVDGGAMLMTLVLAAAVSFLAHLYPVSVALKIQPVRAMQTE